MDIQPHVDSIHHQLVAAAEASGEEGRVLAKRLAAPLDAAIRLSLQDALALAAEEITRELAPGSVELRLRGGQPEFVVTQPPRDDYSTTDLQPAANAWQQTAIAALADESNEAAEMSRINVRMPGQLKVRVEEAASREGLSVNAWLVRAAAAATDRSDPARDRARTAQRNTHRYTGWAR